MRGARLAAIEPTTPDRRGRLGRRRRCARRRCWSASSLPVVILGRMALRSGQNPFEARYLGFVTNSLTLAGIAAVVTVAGAVAIGHHVRAAPGPGLADDGDGGGPRLRRAGRGDRGRAARAVRRARQRDRRLHAGAVRGLDRAVVHRHDLAAGASPTWRGSWRSRSTASTPGLATVSPNMDAVARTLGHSPPRVLWGVHLPIVRGSLLTALLIVFVDVMKELPATMIMRPFNFDTLAVQAYRLAVRRAARPGGGAEPRHRRRRRAAGDPGVPRDRRATRAARRDAPELGRGRSASPETP